MADIQAVHPRACGEHGDNPHGIVILPRFIPAPAGNTAQSQRARVPDTVHPRACGEHGQVPIVGPLATGSSPRLRGTRAA